MVARGLHYQRLLLLNILSLLVEAVGVTVLLAEMETVVVVVVVVPEDTGLTLVLLAAVLPLRPRWV
jgi:hypothetical protein